MRTVKYATDKLTETFYRKKVLNMGTIKTVLGTGSKMTVLRKLKVLGYYASYSHAGRYYTLDEIARFNRYGLWSFEDIYFSSQGSLVNTLEHLISTSEEGCFAAELQELLHVRVHNALAGLYAGDRVQRAQIGSQYLYIDKATGKPQLERRKRSIQAAHSSTNMFADSVFASEKIREGLCTFLSVLNEKQKRLYLGLESIKLGHGGDQLMSSISKVSVKTIGRGRRELESKNITIDRIRACGAGRPSLKKTPPS